MWRHARFPACPLAIILRQPLWNASGQRWRIISSSVLPAGICSSGSDRCWESEVERDESRITPLPEARFHPNRLPKRQWQAFAARAVVLNQFCKRIFKGPNSEGMDPEFRNSKFRYSNREVLGSEFRNPNSKPSNPQVLCSEF